MDWSRFQLVSFAVIIALIAMRALLLWFTIRVNAFKIIQPVELLLLAGTAVFIFLLLREAGWIAAHRQAPVDTMIVNWEPLRYAGAALIVGGIFLFVAALVSFGNSWRIGIDTRNPGQLVTRGVFAFSRNPIFVFIDLYLVGTFLLNGRLSFLLVALAGILGTHFQIRREEKFLQSRHGDAYLKYCARTPRYIGWR